VPGIYISYPFCAQKCTYCNFASGVLPREMESRYHAALLREIARCSWKWTPDTVYLGGGTPSSMETGALREILDALPQCAIAANPVSLPQGPVGQTIVFRGLPGCAAARLGAQNRRAAQGNQGLVTQTSVCALPGRRWVECTIEAAPGTITPAKAAAWREAGINRVSLGVQSFVERELKQTGRKHRADTVAVDVETLRTAGITNINIDLIAGLPFQTEATWRESLDWIVRLDPPHVSVYMLEVDVDSRLGLEILGEGSRYGARQAPSEDVTAALYETAVDFLGAHGLRRYEISNFAKPGFESLHNLKYWRLEPYVGFGSDAHSFDGSHRWQNVESAEEYCSSEDPRCEVTESQPREEKFFVGLRLLDGITPDERDWHEQGPTIRRFLEAGLLEQAGQAIRLTNRGVLLSNEVFQEFLHA
jgi:oxygen-independent coproporphyrinogen III oxidase